MDLRQYTTKEFAEIIGENLEIIKDLIKNNNHLGYTDKPYYHITIVVQNSTIKEKNKEIVTKFIYTSLSNRPEHRFYDTKGYSITLR